MGALTFDAEGVRRELHGTEERVAWARLVKVSVVTTDDGPWGEDHFWLLQGDDGKGVAVPGAEIGPLLAWLQRLPRFDNEAVIKAMTVTRDSSFLLWEGAPGEGLAAAG